VTWAFPDRGRQADKIRAQTVVEEAIALALAKEEKRTRGPMMLEQKRLRKRRTLIAPTVGGKKIAIVYPPEKTFDAREKKGMVLATRIEKVVFAAHNQMRQNPRSFVPIITQ